MQSKDAWVPPPQKNDVNIPIQSFVATKINGEALDALRSASLGRMNDQKKTLRILKRRSDQKDPHAPPF